MPLRRISAVEAFATKRSNPDSVWPRRDDPDDRFAHFADPSFKPRFMLEPGKRIFTIGSCFARGVESALANRGFDVPVLTYRSKRSDWGCNPDGMLNNYVPPAFSPQIRWAFDMERFDLDRHAMQVAPGRFIDLYLPQGVKPASADFVLQRREDINAIYRNLETSHVIILTLGLVEAWFDKRIGRYINQTPPKT